MTYIVVLILTLTCKPSDAACLAHPFIQENATADTWEACQTAISAWVETQRAVHKDGSAFITGCIRK